jgi:ABC-type transport system involved in cytochrome c biogenesis permease subunit
VALPSVTSVMIKLNVKALKTDPVPTACVLQDGHTRVKFPKLTFDGTPTVVLASGMNVSVALTPEKLLKVRPITLNPVPAAFVLNVTVLARALAAIVKTATPTSEAAWTKRPILIFCSLLSCL